MINQIITSHNTESNQHEITPGLTLVKDEESSHKPYIKREKRTSTNKQYVMM